MYIYVYMYICIYVYIYIFIHIYSRRWIENRTRVKFADVLCWDGRLVTCHAPRLRHRWIANRIRVSFEGLFGVTSCYEETWIENRIKVEFYEVFGGKLSSDCAPGMRRRRWKGNRTRVSVWFGLVCRLVVHLQGDVNIKSDESCNLWSYLLGLSGTNCGSRFSPWWTRCTNSEWCVLNKLDFTHNRI